MNQVNVPSDRISGKNKAGKEENALTATRPLFWIYAGLEGLLQNPLVLICLLMLYSPILILLSLGSMRQIGVMATVMLLPILHLVSQLVIDCVLNTNIEGSLLKYIIPLFKKVGRLIIKNNNYYIKLLSLFILFTTGFLIFISSVVFLSNLDNFFFQLLNILMGAYSIDENTRQMLLGTLANNGVVGLLFIMLSVWLYGTLLLRFFVEPLKYSPLSQLNLSVYSFFAYFQPQMFFVLILMILLISLVIIPASLSIFVLSLISMSMYLYSQEVAFIENKQ